MKILDKYILKSFLKPFLATFLIVLFVLVMQALWLAFEDIAGKGIDIIFILKFLYYTALLVTPQALPIAVLLSAIMAMGNFSENYEFAASKSAGISLQRLMRPLIILTVFMSFINFLFLNNVYPYAMFKQKNLYVNIKKQKPSMALVPGSFNTEIPGYHIKFDEKYGENEDLLKRVIIYDLTQKKWNNKIITAKTGKIINKEGSKYMTLVLYNGQFYEDHIEKRTEKNMPVSTAHFKEYSIIITMPDDSLLEEEKLKGFHSMKTLSQLKDTIPYYNDDFQEYIKGRAKSLSINADAKKLIPFVKDTLNLQPNVFDNFDERTQLRMINSSIAKSKNAMSIIINRKESFKFRRKVLNLHEIEYYNRIAFSLSCLILFFIGAPLGSIIRKGGFGLPMILAISIYVLYFFANTFGRNLAEESSITAFLGSWVSALLMVPIAILLTRRATKDMGIFNIDVFLQPITTFIKKISSKKTKTNNGAN
ncbi:MAG: LptF/LptG family permease [Polaribacter sp.]|jgi:lipopolysaccharide export system permease protein|nr:LptF/LptG family permease [Polaribacter sp.]MDG1954242.1 LptF/LptG family permease [Polaribacter sp.]